MSHSRPVLSAVALVVLVALPLTAVAGAVSGPAPAVDTGAAPQSSAVPVAEFPNTTNHLDVSQENVASADHGELSLDVAGAVATDVQRLRSEYSSRAFDAGYGAAKGEDGRIDRLRAEVERLDTRVRILEERQRLAIEAYNADEYTPTQFVRRLATIDAAARGVDGQFDHLRQRGNIILPDGLDDRIVSLRAQIASLHGSVLDRAGQSMAGQRPATHVYALTSENGVVLSTTDDERFHRESYLPGNREAVGTDQFVTEGDPSGITAANDHAREFYPWAYANASPSIQNFKSTSVYTVGLDHSHGTLRTFLDGRTRAVFRELQTLQVGRLPTETATNTSSGIELRVNHTYGTGPMNVTVVDAMTREPVNATVVVNGNRLGTTGSDGSLWAVAPHRAIRIEVRTGDATVRTAFFAN